MSNLQNPSAERILLAGIIKYPEFIYEIDTSFINASDFAVGVNNSVYSIIRDLIIKDSVSKIDKYIIITKAQDLKVGGFDKITETSSTLDALFNVDEISKSTLLEQAKIIKKCSVKRELQTYFDENANRIEKVEGSVAEIIAYAEDSLFQVIQGLASKQDSTTNLFDKFIDIINQFVEQPEMGLNLGLPRFQEDVGYILDGTVHGIFARMKQGKSQLANIFTLRSIFDLNIFPMLIDSELNEKIQIARMAGQISQVPYNLIQTGKWAYSKKYKEAMEVAFKLIQTKKDEGMPLTYLSIPGMSIDEVIINIKKFVMKHVGIIQRERKCLIVYDHIKCSNIEDLKNVREDQYLGYICSRLHETSIKLNIPVILFGQLSRGAIEEDSIKTVADSDKIPRELDSLSVLRRKTDKELDYDPLINGSHLLKILVARHGPGHDATNDYINLKFNLSNGHMDEGVRCTETESFLQFVRAQKEKHEQESVQ